MHMNELVIALNQDDMLSSCVIGRSLKQRRYCEEEFQWRFEREWNNGTYQLTGEALDHPSEATDKFVLYPTGRLGRGHSARYPHMRNPMGHIISGTYLIIRDVPEDVVRNLPHGQEFTVPKCVLRARAYLKGYGGITIEGGRAGGPIREAACHWVD